VTRGIRRERGMGRRGKEKEKGDGLGNNCAGEMSKKKLK